MDGPGDALISQIIDDRVRILVTIMDFVDILDTRTKGSVVELCVESYEVSLVCPVEPMLDLTRLRELRRSNTILDGIDPQVMTVLMPCSCPLEAGQRGRALVEKMKAANIPVTASNRASAAVNGRTREEVQAQLDRMNRVMNGETPIVFYRGRAKNNPSFEDVQLEYRTSQ